MGTGVGRSLGPGIKQQGNSLASAALTLALALAPAFRDRAYLFMHSGGIIKPEQGVCTSELRYSENSTTMASWTGATSGWTWGGGYDDEAGDEEAEMEQSRVRAAL